MNAYECRQVLAAREAQAALAAAPFEAGRRAQDLATFMERQRQDWHDAHGTARSRHSAVEQPHCQRVKQRVGPGRTGAPDHLASLKIGTTPFK